MNTNPTTTMQRLSWRLRHDFQLVLVADVLDRLISKEKTAVAQAAGESSAIEEAAGRIANGLHEALTDPLTPGVITIDEARKIVGDAVDLKGSAHNHTSNLKALAS